MTRLADVLFAGIFGDFWVSIHFLMMDNYRLAFIPAGSTRAGAFFSAVGHKWVNTYTGFVTIT